MKSTLEIQNLTSKASQQIINRLVWHTALKDQVGVVQSLADGKDIQEIYGLGEASLFDEFFCFLDQLGIQSLALKLKPKKKRDTGINFLVVFLIYVMRIVSGVSHFWNIQPVLLQSQPLMHLVGFNAREIRDGTSARGLHKSGDNEKRASDQDNVAANSAPADDLPEADAAIPETTTGSDVDTPDAGRNDRIRGPVCPQFISSFISNIVASALDNFFNAVIKILASNSLFPKKVHVLMDSSEIQSTQRCEGCGKVSKEKAPELRLRRQRIRKVKETVFGFKIWVVWDAVSSFRWPCALLP